MKTWAAHHRVDNLESHGMANSVYGHLEGKDNNENIF